MLIKITDCFVFRIYEYNFNSCMFIMIEAGYMCWHNHPIGHLIKYAIMGTM